MRGLIWQIEGLALLFGGPLLILCAGVLCLVALVFHVRAPWVFWTIGMCAAAGLGLLGFVLLYFRGFSSR